MSDKATIEVHEGYIVLNKGEKPHIFTGTMANAILSAAGMLPYEWPYPVAQQPAACTHTTHVHVAPYEDEVGAMQFPAPETVSTFDHLDTGRMKCSRCGEVAYYTGSWKEFYEKGTPCCCSHMVDRSKQHDHKGKGFLPKPTSPEQEVARSYVWQKSTEGGTNWADVSSAEQYVTNDATRLAAQMKPTSPELRVEAVSYTPPLDPTATMRNIAPEPTAIVGGVTFVTTEAVHRSEKEQAWAEGFAAGESHALRKREAYDRARRVGDIARHTLPPKNPYKV